jgi:hypothetical protein
MSFEGCPWSPPHQQIMGFQLENLTIAYDFSQRVNPTTKCHFGQFYFNMMANITTCSLFSKLSISPFDWSKGIGQLF